MSDGGEKVSGFMLIIGFCIVSRWIVDALRTDKRCGCPAR